MSRNSDRATMDKWGLDHGPSDAHSAAQASASRAVTNFEQHGTDRALIEASPISVAGVRPKASVPYRTNSGDAIRFALRSATTREAKAKAQAKANAARRRSQELAAERATTKSQRDAGTLLSTDVVWQAILNEALS